MGTFTKLRAFSQKVTILVSTSEFGGKMADQANRVHRKTKEKKPHSGGPNPKAFAYATPGKLQRQAARSQDVWDSCPCTCTVLTSLGQRKTPPCPARRPSPRRSASRHRRRRWPSRCWKNHTDQIPDSAIHEADAVLADRTTHCCHIEAKTSYVYRMSGRFVSEHDRYCEGGGYCAADD